MKATRLRVGVALRRLGMYCRAVPKNPRPVTARPVAPAKHATVRIRTAVWIDVCHSHGLRTDEKIAAAIGVGRQTVNAIQNGAREPSASFIAGALIAFRPVRFEDLFELGPKAAS